MFQNVGGCDVRSKMSAGRAEANANVKVAYTTFADDLEHRKVDFRVCSWPMFHKPPPDREGGCSCNDVTSRRRDTDCDDMTDGNGTAVATEALDAGDRRQQTKLDILNAASPIADLYDQNRYDNDRNLHDGVDMFVGVDTEEE
jgi:hypothetical protein